MKSKGGKETHSLPPFLFFVRFSFGFTPARFEPRSFRYFGLVQAP
jgi:hypothetical protein